MATKGARVSFRVNGQLIAAPPLDVIATLYAELRASGSPMLSKYKASGRDVMVCCPWHNNGMEREPSCGIEAEGENAGRVHCFACGKVASISEFVSKCFGREDKGAYGAKWLTQRFITFEVDGKRKLAPIGKPLREQICIIGGVEPKFEAYHPYMDKRKLTPWVRQAFHVGYDPQTDSLTFPVWDAKGRFVCVTRRSCNGKRFDIPKGIEKPVYALNFVTSPTVFVCESVINCLTLWGWGYQAIALFGLGAERQYKELEKSGIRHYVLCFDGDAAGRSGKDRFAKKLGHSVVSWVELPQGKDVNDLTFEEFRSLPHWLAK